MGGPNYPAHGKAAQETLAVLPATGGKIAARTGRTRFAVSEIMRNLSEAGLVERSVCPTCGTEPYWLRKEEGGEQGVRQAMNAVRDWFDPSTEERDPNGIAAEVAILLYFVESQIGGS